MHQGEGGLHGVEGLQGQVEHHRGVLADGVEHGRPLGIGNGLADDADRFVFEDVENVHGVLIVAFTIQQSIDSTV